MTQKKNNSTNFKDYITIYSDGSSHLDSAGAAIVVLDGNEREYKDIQCQYLMLANSYQAELFALLMGIRWFRSSEYFLNDRKRIRNLLVKCDCKSVCDVFAKLQKLKAKGLSFAEACKNFPDEIKRSRKHWEEAYESSDRVEVRWIKGHAGNPFNQLADYLAGNCRTQGELKILKEDIER